MYIESYQEIRNIANAVDEIVAALRYSPAAPAVLGFAPVYVNNDALERGAEKVEEAVFAFLSRCLRRSSISPRDALELDKAVELIRNALLYAPASGVAIYWDAFADDEDGRVVVNPDEALGLRLTRRGMPSLILDAEALEVFTRI